MSRFFICPICKNENPKYIGYINGSPYCRKCISFKGELVDENFKITDNIKLDINYNLTKYQADISSKIVENYKNKFNQLIYAVCGAGKTELVFKVIEFALNNKQRVGFAIPRKDVVIELYERLKFAFKNAKVISLYGGHKEEIEADIVCLTTHQLFRYNNYFDLLILDELDAFPYKDNEVLSNIFLRSIKGNYILMSATPSKEFINEFKKQSGNKLLELPFRFHMKNIPIPQIKIVFFDMFKIIYIFYKIKQYIKQNKQVLIFVPTIYFSKKIYFYLKNLVKPGYFVNSQCEDRYQIIENFKHKKFKYLITTAVLERGITLPNLQVIIFKADHEIYSEETLSQISGRVGRKKEFPNGEVIYLSDKKTKAMVDSISRINEANKVLQKVLQR